MLILTRDQGSEIIIDDDIVVKVTVVKDGNVTLRITDNRFGHTHWMATREQGGEIFIAVDIIIKIVAVKGKQVTLGTTAPRDVPIHRREVWERIQQQKEKGNE